MQLRRKIMNDITGQPRKQKALAIALYIKKSVGRNSIVKNYSTNKLRKITGLSAVTINKYISELKEMGLISFCGKNNEHLVFNKIASHTANRNISVDCFCFDSVRDVYMSIRSFLALIIQSRKDFIKRTIQIATNPQKGQNCKAARKTLKRLVKQGIIRDAYAKYKEYGLSYEKIATELGNCVKTAFSTIQYAIRKGWVTKQLNVEQIYAPKVCFRSIEGYSFCTKNNLYRVHANTYCISAIATVMLGIISL